MKCMDYQVAFNSLLCTGFILAVFRYTEPLQYLETKSGAICIQTRLRMTFINITISIAFLSLLECLINILWGPSSIMNTVREELFGKHWKTVTNDKELLLLLSSTYNIVTKVMLPYHLNWNYCTKVIFLFPLI